jgi:hypothetical protein
MSRETRVNRTVRRALERQMQKLEAKKPPHRNRLLKVLAFLVGVPGVLAALATLLPRLTPIISDPADPDNPLSISVTVTNTGYIPLSLVTASVATCYLCTKGSPCEVPEFPPRLTQCTKFRRAQWGAHYMAIDDRFTFPLNDVLDTADPKGLSYANIAIVLDYEIPLISWKREKAFPLATRKQRNGRLYWYWE